MSEREQRISRGADGEPLGVALFIPADDLPVDTETAEKVRYSVEDGRVVFASE